MQIRSIKLQTVPYNLSHTAHARHKERSTHLTLGGGIKGSFYLNLSFLKVKSHMALFTYNLQQNNDLHLHISKTNITGSKSFRSDYLVQPLI